MSKVKSPFQKKQLAYDRDHRTLAEYAAWMPQSLIAGTSMARKKLPPKLPPPGREPTPQHLRSVWATDYIPDWALPATPEAIASAEARLGVVIPKVLKTQLAVQNG